MFKRFALTLALSAAALVAQPTQRGAFEISAGGGIASTPSDFTEGVRAGAGSIGVPGVSVTPGSGAGWNAGGSIAYAATPKLLLVGRFSRDKIGNPSIQASGTSATVNALMTQVSFGAQYQLPFHKRFAPYVGGAAGIGRLSASVDAPGPAGSIGAAAIDRLYMVETGVRWYLTPSFGVRPQLEWIHVPGSTYARAGAALFYQFGN